MIEAVAGLEQARTAASSALSKSLLMRFSNGMSPLVIRRRLSAVTALLLLPSFEAEGLAARRFQPPPAAMNCLVVLDGELEVVGRVVAEDRLDGVDEALGRRRVPVLVACRASCGRGLSTVPEGFVFLRPHDGTASPGRRSSPPWIKKCTPIEPHQVTRFASIAETVPSYHRPRRSTQRGQAGVNRLPTSYANTLRVARAGGPPAMARCNGGFCGVNKKRRPRGRRLLNKCGGAATDGPKQRSARSELVEDLVDPEAFEAAECLVEAFEGVVVEAADLVDGLEVTIIEFVDHFGHFLALGGRGGCGPNGGRRASAPGRCSRSRPAS